MSVKEEYSQRLSQFRADEQKYGKVCTLLTWSRLTAFLGTVLFVYLAVTSAYFVGLFGLAGLSLIAFLVLIKVNAGFTKKRDYASRLALLCENELKFLEFDFLDFQDGSEFMDPEHAFSSDLDIFGAGSAYQYINRTVSFMGRNTLVRWLSDPSVDGNEIRQRQESCKEISKLTDWRLHFAATGRENELADNPQNLLDWLKMPDMFTNHTVWLRGLKILWVFMCLLLAAVIAGRVDFNVLVLAGLVNLGVTGVYLRRINGISQVFGKSYPMLAKYSGMFLKLGEADFKSPWLREKAGQLFLPDGEASREISLLRKLLQQFDSRNNLLVGFFRDALFLTDLFLVIRMESWRIRNAGKIGNWLEALGDVDALSSLATFAFNNPGYAYPVPVSGEFRIKVINMGHPLIPSAERICNDFTIKGWHSLMVLTGANMAGKSTFLRTAGLNHILAHSGAPVCASGYEFLPSRLITSIRTNDSLIKHESYFYAELRKLKSIIDALEQGRELFILLDEVLKGTNSNDKLNGSIILIRKLIRLQTSGIIATHDISLGELEAEFPENIFTGCFEAEISGNQLHFDYRLKPGTARNMTAIFLMKQMGIVS